ncbi:MAG TPA: RNase III inhibitor, partial [Sphaerochaeta sp.]|nr:RNase III inhibitor [Sphaerochaeta sp.]
VIAFALSLQLNRSQTSDLLESAGFCLSHSYLSDIIIEYYIENRLYDIHTINETLFAYKQPLLGS